MGLVDRIAAKQAASAEIRRADPVTMEEFGYLLGQGRGLVGKTRTGVSMGPQRAMGISAWYSGVRYLSETVAGLPVDVIRDRNGMREHRAMPPWMRRPDDELVWFGWVEFQMMSLLHRGGGFSFKKRDPVSAQVTGLRVIHPDRMQVGQTSGGRKLFVVDGDRERPFTSYEILHIPGLSYDGVVGLNPIAVQAETLGLIAAADEFAGRSYDSSTVRSFLSVPQTITETEANELAEVWESQHRGLVNAGKVAVMGGGAEYRHIDLDPSQVQLLESRKFGVSEVARILRIPPHKLYDLERATFSNIEQQSIEAVIDGIRPWCTRIEAWVNADPDLLPPRNGIEFNLEGLLRGDQKSRFEAYSAGVQGGYLMPSEPRRKENLPYVEGSDFLLRPLAMTPYGPDAAAHPMPDPAPQEVPA